MALDSSTVTLLGWLMEGPEAGEDRGANPYLPWPKIEHVRELVVSQPWSVLNGLTGTGARVYCTGHEALIMLCLREGVLTKDEADVYMARITLALMGG